MRSFWKLYYDENVREFLDKPQVRLKTVNDAFIFYGKNILVTKNNALIKLQYSLVSEIAVKNFEFVS